MSYAQFCPLRIRVFIVLPFTFHAPTKSRIAKNVNNLYTTGTSQDVANITEFTSRNFLHILSSLLTKKILFKSYTVYN